MVAHVKFVAVTAPTYNAEDLVRKWQRQFKSIQDQARVDVKKTFETWDSRPKVHVTRTLNRSTIDVIINVDSELWHMLDRGTQAHVISASNKKMLRFNTSGYTAKTVPNFLKSQAGGFVGGTYASAGSVMHPGTEARNWTIVISEKYGPKLLDRILDINEVWVSRHNAKGNSKANTLLAIRSLLGD